MENVNFKMLIKCICNLEKKEILYYTVLKNKTNKLQNKTLVTCNFKFVLTSDQKKSLILSQVLHS